MLGKLFCPSSHKLGLSQLQLPEGSVTDLLCPELSHQQTNQCQAPSQHHGTCSPPTKLPCQCPHTNTITSCIFSNVVNRDAGCYCRERADAVAGLRQARAEPMQVSMPKAASPEGSLAGPLSLVPQPSSLDLAAGIDGLMAALKPRHSQAGGGASEDGSSAMSGEFRIGSHRAPESVWSDICCMFGRAQTILSAAWDCDPSALLIRCQLSVSMLRMLCLQAQPPETDTRHTAPPPPPPPHTPRFARHHAVSACFSQ